ncbi:MFS transporter [Pseudomonas asiatica]|uniref:MFS transporter n=1 Tax=Pseudomonas asiatica TaxID=2219225 RepID=UPI0010C100E7|nr:MFS transporter [Pseudomonas asiatica]
MQRIELHDLTEEARLTGLHWIVLAWCFGLLIIDGYDLAIVGAALPAIMQAMGTEATSAGFMASSGLVGMVFGAILFGTLADRIGRRWAISLCVFLFSAFTAAAGFAHEPLGFSVLRFVAGIGMGGAVPNVVSLMSEYAPRKVRNVLMTLMCCGYALGSMLAALLGKQLLISHGWQSVFFVAGVPLLLIPFILRYMPESLAFLLRKKGSQALLASARRLRPDLQLPAQCEFVLPEVDQRSGDSVGRLFSEGRGFSTLMFWVAGIAGLFVLYALSSWLVKLMSLAGHDLGSALNYLIAFNTGGSWGRGWGWVGDRLGLKWVSFVLFIVGAVALMLLARGVQPLSLVVMLVGASTMGTQLLVYIYTAQFYPASIRSTGLGFATGLGRIGAVSAPIVIGLLVSLQLPLMGNFLVIACVSLVGAIAIALVDERASAYRRASHRVASEAQRLE